MARPLAHLDSHEPTPWPHPACLADEDLLKQCRIGRGRAGGPGGQNRNKVETLVIITHLPTNLEAHAGERRSQGENKAVALRRLRLLLATRVRVDPPPPPRDLDALLAPGGACSALWRSRRRTVGGTGRIACNPEHRDFPSLLAEALDVIAASAWEPAPAARRLDVTTSQLIGLVRDHPPALLAWNAARAQRGLHAIK